MDTARGDTKADRAPATRRRGSYDAERVEKKATQHGRQNAEQERRESIERKSQGTPLEDFTQHLRAGEKRKRERKED